MPTTPGSTAAVAESATGGLISASLLSVPGASSYFLAGATVYTYASRNVFLDLHREDVARRGSSAGAGPRLLS